MARIYLKNEPLAPRHALTVARKTAGLTQADIGARVGVTPECVAHWEHARHDSKTEAFLAAMEACGYEVRVVRKR